MSNAGQGCLYCLLSRSFVRQRSRRPRRRRHERMFQLIEPNGPPSELLYSCPWTVDAYPHLMSFTLLWNLPTRYPVNCNARISEQNALLSRETYDWKISVRIGNWERSGARYWKGTLTQLGGFYPGSTFGCGWTKSAEEPVEWNETLETISRQSGNHSCFISVCSRCAAETGVIKIYHVFVCVYVADIRASDIWFIHIWGLHDLPPALLYSIVRSCYMLCSPGMIFSATDFYGYILQK